MPVYHVTDYVDAKNVFTTASGAAWSNVGLAGANVVCNFANQISDTLYFSVNPGDFGIPANATVIAVEVTLEKAEIIVLGGSGLGDAGVGMYLVVDGDSAGGTENGPSSLDPALGTPATLIIGNVTDDLWGAALSPGDVNSGLGVSLVFLSSISSLRFFPDSVRVRFRVAYTTPDPAPEKVKIDEAVVHSLFAGAFEQASNLTGLVRMQLGEEEPDNADLLAAHVQLTLTPEKRVSGISQPDFATVAYTVKIEVPEGQQVASAAAITSAAAEVAAALDEFTGRDEDTTHQLDLGRAVVTIQSGEVLAGVASATVTGEGTCQRLTGNSRRNFTQSS